MCSTQWAEQSNVFSPSGRTVCSAHWVEHIGLFSPVGRTHQTVRHCSTRWAEHIGLFSPMGRTHQTVRPDGPNTSDCSAQWVEHIRLFDPMGRTVVIGQACQKKSRCFFALFVTFWGGLETHFSFFHCNFFS